MQRGSGRPRKGALNWTRLYLLTLPAAAFEENDARGGDGGFGDDDGDVDTVRLHANGNRQEVGEGNLQQPEAEEMHDGGSDGVAGAVKSLKHDHAVGVADIAVAQDAQAGDGQRDDGWIAGEEANDWLGEDHKEQADEAEK